MQLAFKLDEGGMMARLGLVCIAVIGVACSEMDVSFTTASSSDDALRQAAELSGEQSLDLVSEGAGTELNMEESFVPSRVKNRKLDILMVIDESQSMQARREKLAANLSHLLKYEGLANSDWRIGVVSSARDSLLRQPFITAANQEQEFAEQVKNPGSGHSSDRNVERALYNASLALQGNAGRDWLRKNSIAVVLIITDEDHRQCNRDTESCSDVAAYSLQNFYEELRNLRQPQVTAKIYGILSDNSDRRENFLSQIVLEGGDNGSLFTAWESLEEDYSTVLQDISKNVADTLQSTFTLQQEYSGDSAEVVINTVGGRKTALSEDEYEITDRTLSIYEGLLDELGDVETVVVTYTYLREE